VLLDCERSDLVHKGDGMKTLFFALSIALSASGQCMWMFDGRVIACHHSEAPVSLAQIPDQIPEVEERLISATVPTTLAYFTTYQKSACEEDADALMQRFIEMPASKVKVGDILAFESNFAPLGGYRNCEKTLDWLRKIVK
jgi:hypothetical protein